MHALDGDRFGNRQNEKMEAENPWANPPCGREQGGASREKPTEVILLLTVTCVVTSGH